MADLMNTLLDNQQPEQPQPDQNAARVPSKGLIETLLQLLNVKGLKPNQQTTDALNQIALQDK